MYERGEMMDGTELFLRGLLEEMFVCYCGVCLEERGFVGIYSDSVRTVPGSAQTKDTPQLLLSLFRSSSLPRPLPLSYFFFFSPSFSPSL